MRRVPAAAARTVSMNSTDRRSPLTAALRRLTALAGCAVLATCGGGGGGGSQAPTNVLLIVGDDIGIDMIGAYGFHPGAPPTPTIDGLIARGVRFTQAYASPTCSPSRACVLTGRYGFRTGLGEPIQEWLPEHALLLSEVTLPEMLNNAAPRPIDTAAIGKWHLGSPSIGGFAHPNLQGFEFYRGTFGNLQLGQTYDAHQVDENGVVSSSTTYCTTEQVDDALARIATMSEPWFTYLCFNAGHKPFHAPPANLHSYALSGNPDLTPNEHFCAAVQALDTELGRLLDGIDPAVLARTTVIFLGDNGSPNEAVTPPSIAGASKGTVYQGGVHVPLVIAGKHVTQSGVTCDALVDAVDLFPTIADLFGVDMRAGIGDARTIDGVSALPYLLDPAAPPQRAYSFADKFSPNGFTAHTSSGAMLRDERWKLVRRDGQTDQLFDIGAQFLEGNDLVPFGLNTEQQQAYTRLQTELDALLSSP